MHSVRKNRVWVRNQREFLIHVLFPLVTLNLSASGQKEIEQAQDAGLSLLEAHVKHKSGSIQRKAKLLLFLGHVKALSKDVTMLVEDKRILGSEKDDNLLKFISQSF